MAARIRMNAGVKIDGDKICLLLFADNVVVMSRTIKELQNLLDVREYGRDFGVKFNSEKGKVMIVNRSEDEGDTVWKLGLVVPPTGLNG